MAIIVASIVISLLVVQGSSVARIDSSLKMFKLPADAMFPFTSIGDATSFMQSFLRHNNRPKQLHTPNASASTVVNLNYAIISFNDASCRVRSLEKRTNHLVASGTPGCFNIVDGPLAGSSFGLSCPEGDVAEQVMQQIYHAQDCEGRAGMQKTMKWKLFKGICQNRQKMDPPLNYDHFPLCKSRVEAKGACDCSWVKTKRKSCEVTLNDGSPCFTVCCGKVSPQAAASPTIMATSMNASTNQNKSVHLTGQRKKINATSKQNLTNNSIKNKSINHSKVMEGRSNQSKKASDSINRSTIPNASADQIEVKVPESMPNLADTRLSVDPTVAVEESILLRSESDLRDTDASHDPKVDIVKRKEGVPHMIGTCECTWANKPDACSGLRRMGHCQRICCNAKITVNIANNTEQLRRTPVSEAHSEKNQSQKIASHVQTQGTKSESQPQQNQSQNFTSREQINRTNDVPPMPTANKTYPVDKTQSNDTQSHETASNPAKAEEPEALFIYANNRTREQIEGEKLEKNAMSMARKAEKLRRSAQDTVVQAIKARQNAKDLKILSEQADAQYHKLSAKAINIGQKSQAWNKKAEALDEQAKVLIMEARCNCDSAIMSTECAKRRHRSYCGKICCLGSGNTTNMKRQNQNGNVSFAVSQVRKTM